MHQALIKEFDNLKTLALEKGKSISLMQTQMDNVVFISSNKKLVCLVIIEGKIHNTLACYRVDRAKWNWAENEGFDLKDGIPNDLASQILIKFKNPEEYLSFLGL